jgi:hypothetical protein
LNLNLELYKLLSKPKAIALFCILVLYDDQMYNNKAILIGKL